MEYARKTSGSERLMTMECPDFLRQEEAEAMPLVHACAKRYGWGGDPLHLHAALRPDDRTGR